MQIFLDESILLSSIGLTLVHFLWQGVAIAVTLKIALITLPKSNAQARYLAATIALVSCLVLPIATFFYIYQPEQIANQSTLLAPITTLFDLQANQGMQPVWQQNFAETLPHLTIIWFSVVFLLAIKFLVEIRSVTRLPFEQSVDASASLEQRFTELCNRMGFTNKLPRLRISLKANVPMAIGFIKPVVILPAAMITGLTPTQLDMLILHELAHIRRHDYFVNLIQSLAEIILFFHPVVYWISKQMRVEREFCSDDMAVKQCGNPIAYAHTLADTASLCHKHRNHSIPMMAMAASGGDLKARIIRLVQPHHCTQNNETSRWLASIVVVTSIILFAASQFAKINNIVLNASPSLLINAVAKPQSLTVYEASTALFDDKTLPPLSIAQQLLSDDNVSNGDNYASTPNSYSRPAAIPSEYDNEKGVITEQQKNAPITPPAPSSNSVLTQPSIKSNTLISAKALPSTKKIDQTVEFKINQLSPKTLEENKYSRELQALTTPRVESAPKVNKPVDQSVKKIATKTQQPSELPAQLIQSQEPKYPIAAKRKKLEIEVLVNFTIDKQGFVKDISFDYQPKVSYFRTTIRHALSEWRFKPAQKDGKAVESQMSKIFSFSLAH
ncbi:TonB family protein [Thalassotalea sp. LPB0316]|uniref:M56 family metallopeptidase n=1 Tax=Thalassotalea sp. LPB0316 TaxID=2769490 RepID=UPI0018686389|nr:M56 family metallopeptidase [Thalassotalea sp. LPB0316]QOL26521.1 TonB family protein [Thalassotalea sp. LPB0316]